MNHTSRDLLDLPYCDLGFAKIDTHRHLRKQLGEVVYCRGKTIEQILKISERLILNTNILLLTKANEKVYEAIKNKFPRAKFNKLAGMIWLVKKKVVKKDTLAAVITAGTSDIPVAEEAVVTLDLMGNGFKKIYDVGVAGIHRVLDKRKIFNRADCLIVVAGMEGALVSVIAGLTSKPIIAVPTSVGYGASFRGVGPLLTMLNCCAPGVVVVNIDNGFGAGYFASLILSRK